MSNNTANRANRLAQESSPYLLQHAYNPVDWFPWGKEALEKAKAENKPILVSIGYSACHWCHVMEKQSFENDSIAALMNEHLISIKVDREERPDIDQIYMDAVQAMGIRGGWPLNVFLTPDAKPFYGGTYFPPSDFGNIVIQVSNAYKNKPEDILKSAESFAQSLRYKEVDKYGLHAGDKEFTKAELEKSYRTLENHFDPNLGGLDREPKFPMPSIWLFLMRYYKLSGDEVALRQTTLTLEKMAQGGIYDQIGGGFARYSVDIQWFAPHFEKMLYDNGQLLSVYSEAYALTKNESYKEVVYETIEWVKREMTSPEGGFYSALDADSEGEEGKFYVWKYEELAPLLKDDLTLFCEYYQVTPEGNWEHENNILIRGISDQAFCKKQKLSLKELQTKIIQWKKILFEAREKKIRPGLDDKILASWNGLMLKGIVDAYRVFDEERFIQLAKRNASFLLSKMRNGEALFHSYKNGKATIEAYLEDYSFVVAGLISLYEATFEEHWLDEAGMLTNYVVDHFFDPEDQLFYFTSNTSEKLIARKKELFDNVIPASNSAMALNLYQIGLLSGNESWKEQAIHMLSRMKKVVINEPSFMTNWACLFSLLTKPTAEIAISGKDALKLRKEFDQHYTPNKVMAGTTSYSDMALLKGRDASEKTLIYVCYNNTCQLPVETVEAALNLIDNG